MDESPSRVSIVVVGAHLSGQPLNHQLTDRDATFVQATHDRAVLPALRARHRAAEARPGAHRAADDDRGRAIEVEVWELDVAAFGDFVAQVPAPMCIGRVRLADGREVSGFLCEPVAIEGAAEITQFGGWRAYRASAADRA